MTVTRVEFFFAKIPDYLVDLTGMSPWDLAHDTQSVLRTALPHLNYVGNSIIGDHVNIETGW